MVRELLIKMCLLPADYRLVWPEIELHDIRKNWPLKNKSVDFIYCSHVLEHFEKEETKQVLKESRRVLKKNGWLRIVLPDLKKMTGNYKNADDFCREFYGFEKDEMSGWQRYLVRGHQWMYDQKSLTKMLQEVGFKKVLVKEFGEGKCPDLEKLDYEPHRKISMYVETQ